MMARPTLSRRCWPAMAKRVRVLRQDNGGPAAARNTGVRAASAPLIAFLDADDLWEPTKLEAQLTALRERPGLGAVCSDAWLLREGLPLSRKWGSASERGAPDLSFDGLLLANPISTLTVLARRELLLRAGLFDEDRRLIAVEDYDLWLRLAELAPIGWIDAPLARYRVHASSLSSTETFLRGVTLVLDKLRRRHPEPRPAGLGPSPARGRAPSRRGLVPAPARAARPGGAPAARSPRPPPLLQEGLEALAALDLARVESAGGAAAPLTRDERLRRIARRFPASAVPETHVQGPVCRATSSSSNRPPRPGS